MPDIERRRAAAAAAWDVGDTVVLVAAGDEMPVPGAATARTRTARTPSTCT